MGRKPERKTVSLRTATASQANGPGKVAPHTEAPGASPGGKAEGVPLQFACFSGETSTPGTPTAGSGTTGNRRVEDGGVSRGHRSALARARRPEPVGCDSTPEPRPPTQTPHGRVEGLEDSVGTHGGTQAHRLEQILSRDNMRLAWQRVKANTGAAGMDGRSIDACPEFARQHWERIRSALETGTYRPAAVLRVMMPKASGGERPLGIPTVLDRGIQQAIAQVIGPLFEPHFSTHSDGCRPGRRANMALEASGDKSSVQVAEMKHAATLGAIQGATAGAMAESLLAFVRESEALAQKEEAKRKEIMQEAEIEEDTEEIRGKDSTSSGAGDVSTPAANQF